MEIMSQFLLNDKSSNVILPPGDEGSTGFCTPEYQLSSRVAMSQLKEPRVMKVDMRSPVAYLYKVVIMNVFPFH